MDTQKPKASWLKKAIYGVLAILVIQIFVGSFSDAKKKVENSKAPQIATSTQDTASIEKNTKELKELMDIAIKAHLVYSYDFTNGANVIMVDAIWYTQTVTFKKDFLAKVAMLKQNVTGYRHFEMRDMYTNEKVAEVTAFSGSLEVYK